MADIKRTIELEYITTGLDNAVKALQQVDPSQMGGAQQDKINKAFQQLQTLSQQAQEAVAKGAGPETIAVLTQEYEKLMRRVSGMVSKMFLDSTNVANAEITQIQNELAVQENKLFNLTKDRAQLIKGFLIGPEGELSADSKRARESVAEESLRIVREETRLREDLLTRSKEQQATAALILGTEEKIVEAVKTLGPQTEVLYNQYLKNGVATEQINKTFEQIKQTMGSNLRVEELMERQKVAILIKQQESVALANRANDLAELDIKLATEQNELYRLRSEIAKQIEKASQDAVADPELTNKLRIVLEAFNKETERYNQLKRFKIQNEKEDESATKKSGDALNAKSTTLGKAANQVFNYGIAFTALRRIYRETLRTITDLDKAFTEMAIVTTMNREQTWQLADAMFNLAEQTGFTATEIAKLSTQYFRQGRSMRDVLILTEVTAKAARIAGISTSESVNFLTSAVNGFGLAADQALAVSDRFAALAASSASSYEELANGLSKFAAQANVAGVSIDFALGMLAKGVETTREAPETIGTAIKTVLARMRELTDYGKTLEEGMDVSRVERALQQVGIQLRDTNGQFRDMELVLKEIGYAWEGYNTNQRAAIAVSLAGTRQQSRLIAIMNDFDRTLELVNISQESAGATNAQQVKFMQGLEAALVNLQTAYQNFIRTLTDTQLIIDIVNLLTAGLKNLSAGLKTFGIAGKTAMTAIIGLFTISKLLPIFTKLKVTLGLTTAAAKGTTAAVKGLNLAMASNVIGIFLVAGAALVTLVGDIQRASEKATEALKEKNDQIQASQFEYNKLTKTISKSIEEINKLNKLPFLTTEQEKDLENAKERIAELVGEQNIVRNIRGEVDLKASEQAIKDFLEEQKLSVAKSVTEGYKLAVKDLVKIEADGNRNPLVTFATTTDKQTVNAIYTYFLAQYEEAFGEVSGPVSALYKEVIKDILMTDSQTLATTKNIDNFVKSQAEPIISFLETSVKEIENFSEDLSSQYEVFNKNIESANDKQRDLLIKQYSALAAIRKEFGSSGQQVAEGLKEAGLLELEDVQQAVATYGKDLPIILQEINSRTKEILESNAGTSRVTALSIAWSELSRQVASTEKQQFAYSQAFKKTSLSIAQDVDVLDSKFKSLVETQEKYLKGDLSAQEIEKFIGLNIELFENLEQVQAFLAGEDLTANLFGKRIEARSENVARLTDAYIRLNAATTDQDRFGPLRDIALFSALLQYNGALKQTSIQQQEFNNLLKQYNLLNKFGIEDTELNTKLLQAQARFINTNSNTALQKINQLKEGFNDLIGKEGLSGSFDDFIQIVNGTAIPVFDNLKGISSEFAKELERAIGAVQGQLDSIFNAFEEIRKDNLSREKESLDSQRKLYENYFAALDRLEEQRSRKLNRQKLVEQLSRLEGATDERSRKRALDLRKELNVLDEQSAKTSQEESRAALLESFDKRYEDLERRWALAGQEFIANMSEGGVKAADAFKNAIDANGLLPGISAEFDMGDFASILVTFADTLQETLKDLKTETVETTKTFDMTLQQAMQAMAAAGGLSGTQYGQGQFSNAIGENTLAAQQTQTWWAGMRKWLLGFDKGGLVDFTGVAQLHGSKSSPEAVLNPQQTQMFMGLRDALQGISFDGGPASTVNIENIEIKTDSLNSNQDFSRAGETLANAFNNAIQRRGLVINTKK